MRARPLPRQQGPIVRLRLLQWPTVCLLLGLTCPVGFISHRELCRIVLALRRKEINKKTSRLFGRLSYENQTIRGSSGNKHGQVGSNLSSWDIFFSRFWFFSTSFCLIEKKPRLNNVVSKILCEGRIIDREY